MRGKAVLTAVRLLASALVTQPMLSRVDGDADAESPPPTAKRNTDAGGMCPMCSSGMCP